MDDAMSQFNQMITEGLAPGTIVFNHLISGFCTCGKWEKVHELFSEMLDRASVQTQCSSTQLWIAFAKMEGLRKPRISLT